MYSVEITIPADITASEEGELEWFALDNLPVDGIVDDVPMLISGILDANIRKTLFSLLYTYDTNGNRITTSAKY